MGNAIQSSKFRGKIKSCDFAEADGILASCEFVYDGASTTLKTLSYDGQETIWLVRAQEVAWFRFLIETELPPWPLPESRSVLASSVDVVQQPSRARGGYVTGNFGNFFFDVFTVCNCDLLCCLTQSHSQFQIQDFEDRIATFCGLVVTLTLTVKQNNFPREAEDPLGPI